MGKLRLALGKIRCIGRLSAIRLFGGRQIDIGSNLSFRKGFVLNASTREARIFIGDNCFFNGYCSINCREKVTIGDNCIFGENVKIYDHDHVFSRSDLPIRDQGFVCSPVVIGDNCWFGSNVVVLKGVKVGKNCIIGAGAVVSKDVPENTITIAKQNVVQRSRTDSSAS